MMPVKSALKVALAAIYAATGAYLLLRYAEPCDPGHLCAMAALPGTWAQQLRTWWHDTQAPQQQQPASDMADRMHTPAPLAQSPYISTALQAAWHDGFATAEPMAYRQGWWSGLRTGFAIALYLGVPLVYAGYWLGRAVLGALGWLS